MTYKDLLSYYQQCFKDNNLEEYAATYLLADCLKIETSALFSYLNNEVDKKIQRKYQKYCHQYLNLKPAQYITNKAYFYNLELYVDNRVLIPRQETEQLVDIVNKDIQGTDNLKILDLCSGSGCIGLAIKKFNPSNEVYCSDISKKANKVAFKNKNKLNININILNGDLFEPYFKINNKVDIIVSNPPYIGLEDSEVDESTLLYEPHLALFTRDIEGIEIYLRIIQELEDIDFKACYLEIGYKQKSVLEEVLKKSNLYYEFRQDYSHKDRFLIIRKRSI